MDFSARARKIKAIILDVDGVMTDGTVGYTGGGDPIKFFNVRDGHAIKMALRQGLLVGIISGRSDAATTRRAEELQMSFLHAGQKVKLEALAKVLAEFGLTADECLYVGDDVVDIPVMRKVGLAVCVADADPALLPFAHWQTSLGGGAGAVREVIFRIMQEQGAWDAAMERYLGPLPELP